MTAAPSTRGAPAPASTGPILEARDLVAGYGQIRALKGISFQVGDGQVVALLSLIHI